MQAQGARESYTWEVAGKPIAIHIDFPVIDRLGLDVMRGFGAVPKRGAEVGGILLGRVEHGERTVVSIHDFEAVPCEYAYGPSYHLSEADLQRLKSALDYWAPENDREFTVVGFYRSHTREGLALGSEDYGLCARFFHDSSHVVLLVKPSALAAPVAGFFFQENGVLRGKSSYLEFPFRRRELGGGSSGGSERHSHARGRSRDPEPPRGTAGATAPAAELAPGAPPDLAIDRPLFAEYQREPPRWKARFAWMSFALAAMLLGAVAGFQYAGGQFQTSTASAAQDAYTLGVAAQRIDDNVLVRWNSEAPAVKAAWRGLLTISEGADSKIVQLDAAQLRNGSVLYRKVAPEIDFKFEVLLKENRAVVERLHWRLP
ncbi:MAG: hypothetical protein HYZ57_17770 [Acidobacteria bacterium]|nr:hypothetical protein [Acidobacteriota bacterium]